MTENICGCCEGLETLTPMNTANRPGLDSLYYRVGTHATFLETMKARLSSGNYPELEGLRVRDPSDPAIAFLDAWATIGDILTFYQERIANEGYLRTATESFSIIELARLVGYKLRPGVASSVFLAFNVEKASMVEIPVGTCAQSLPSSGEQPQFFETSEPLQSCVDWNSLKPRMTRPQEITIKNVLGIKRILIQGTEKNLATNDLLLFVFENEETALRRIHEVNLLFGENCAEVILQKMPENLLRVGETILGDLFYDNLDKMQNGAKDIFLEMKRNLLNGASYIDLTDLLKKLSNALKGSELVELSDAIIALDDNSEAESNNDTEVQSDVSGISELVRDLTMPPSIQPTSGSNLALDFTKIFSSLSDSHLGFYSNIMRINIKDLLTMIANATTHPPHSDLKAVYVFRLRAPLFGQNVQDIPIYKRTGAIQDPPKWWKWPVADDESEKKIFLNAQYRHILPGSYVAIQKPGVDTFQIFSNIEVRFGNRCAYGFGGETTEISLKSNWRSEKDEKKFDVIRNTVVYAQSEELKLAEEPIEEPIKEDKIELNGIISGLQSGRWMIISGEREIKGTHGINACELFMLSGVDQPKLEKLEGQNSSKSDIRDYTVLQLAEPLTYSYKRETVAIYANVTKATHGQTHMDVLGNGKYGQKFQEFSLKVSPLTYLPAPTSSGADGTLEVRANNVLWHETDSLAGLGPRDRSYITRSNEDGKMSIIFGDGVRGASLPTGIENIKAKYRSGIGKPGNVKAEQIKNLVSRPLGVKGVINPLPATGGADGENRDKARQNAPLAVMALDRLVSVQDYTDFVRTFAGIGKARATRLSDGQKEIIYITIAGIDDIPIATTSELYRNLRLALHKHGDPRLPVQIEVRGLLLLVMSAKVRVLPDYQWEESVCQNVRAALLDAFSFERQELGKDLLLSEVISTIQKVEGVEYVDVDTIGGIPENGPYGSIWTPGEIANLIEDMVTESKAKGPKQRIPVNLAATRNVCPDQIAYLIPDMPETLILTELKS